MSAFIRTSVLTIEQFFRQPRFIELPWFQRAYAWRDDNVLRLVDDVIEAMKGSKQRYSLGHIHLAGEEAASGVAIVDGHQRTMTLAIIFSVLRDLVAADQSLPEQTRVATQNRLQALIEWDERPPGARSRWRLVPQSQLADFFEKYVQQPGATRIDPLEDIDELTPVERNIFNNRERLLERLGPRKLRSANRLRLIEFLLTRCFVVTIEVDDEDEAWSMLGVQQKTRLAHDASEQAKIAIIYSMPQREQEEAASIWEYKQSQLGNERLAELLVHLRTLRIDKRSQKPLEVELQQIYELNVNGLRFMQLYFRPFAQALRQLDQGAIGTGMMAGVIKGHIDAMGWLDHRQWVAPALAWLVSKGDQHRETGDFFARLDRLAWMLRLAGTDPHDQENRFIQLTRAAGRDAPVTEWAEFEVAPRTVDDALTVLRSRTFYLKHQAKNVLRRLSLLMGSDPGFIDGGSITVEHVLPHKPPKGSRWLSDFSGGGGVKEHADRLGNLCVLPGKVNREADNKDWPLKRAIYATCLDSSPSFALVVDALHYETWTPAVVHERTERLIRLLFDHWQLKVTPP